jgi:hypothetical protein
MTRSPSISLRGRGTNVSLEVERSNAGEEVMNVKRENVQPRLEEGDIVCPVYFRRVLKVLRNLGVRLCADQVPI